MVDLDIKDSEIYKSVVFVTGLLHIFESSLERMAMLERELSVAGIQSSLCKRNVVDHSLWFGALSRCESWL